MTTPKADEEKQGAAGMVRVEFDDGTGDDGDGGEEEAAEEVEDLTQLMGHNNHNNNNDDVEEQEYVGLRGVVVGD